MSQTIKLDSLRELIAAGGVKSTTILGQRGGFAVVANIGIQSRVLGTRAGEMRMFGRLDTAVKALRDLGVAQFQVDVTHYQEGSLRPGRPDTRKRAAAANEALAHERWFRDQVQTAKDKLDSGSAVLHGHDDVFDRLEAHAAKRVAERQAVGETAPSHKPERS